jgi:membrane protein DedA with SNARE-associated domain
MFMDFLPDNETLSFLLLEWGGIALFALLALEIIALPIPGEPLMILAGILLGSGDLSLAPTLIAAYLGALSGINVSYFLGRTAGSYLVAGYGPRIGLTNAMMHRVNSWFSRFGKWTLIIGYFVPGVRHFTGFTAGMTSLSYKTFALFAYVGALLWVSCFLSLGYFLGDYWVSIFDIIFNSVRNLFS